VVSRPVRRGLFAALSWIAALVVISWLRPGSGPHSFEVLLVLVSSPLAFAAGCWWAGRHPA
jgi:hypothetical protein